MTLETGTSDAVNYTSGSGSTELTFNYTIAAGHTSTDLDYKATNSLGLLSGIINDIAGNAATLTLASPFQDHLVQIRLLSLMEMYLLFHQ